MSIRIASVKNNKPVISERVFQAQVIQLARRLGWLTAHFRPAMTKRGRWLTAVQGDGAGFPDCVLLRANRVIFAELKSDKGKVTAEQQRWLMAAREAGLEVYIWRPCEYDSVYEVLK